LLNKFFVSLGYAVMCLKTRRFHLGCLHRFNSVNTFGEII
jgi:hypothetical protein